MSIKLPTSTWATQTLYPAGANRWNGDVTKLNPPSSYLIPGQGVPAQWLNAIFAAQTQDVANLYANVSPFQALNWRSSADNGAFTGVTTPNPLSLQSYKAGATGLATWAAFVVDSTGHPSVWLSTDSGMSWTAQATSSLQSNSGVVSSVVSSKLAVSPTGGLLFGYGQTTAPTALLFASGSWSSSTVFTGSSGHNYRYDVLCWFNNLWVALVYDTTATAVALYTSSNGSTWTVTTATLSIFFGQTGAVSTQGNGILLLVPQGISGTSTVSYLTTTDGVTWTVANAPSLSFGESITSVSFDTVRGVFVMLTSIGKVYTSATAGTGTWNLAPSATSSVTVGGNPNSIACLGALWLVSDASVGCYSTDAGNSWTLCSLPGMSVAQLATSPYGFAMWDITVKTYRMSLLLG